MRGCIALMAVSVLAAAQTPPAQTNVPQDEPARLEQPAPDSKAAETAPASVESQSKRIELNLLGRTNTGAGESRRNENIHFNLVDNNALKELNVRLGTTATILEFRPERGYFGAEYGNAPTPVLHLSPLSRVLDGWHGTAFETLQNSVFSARSFFQVGGVKPAHDNEYGFSTGGALWRGAHLTLTGSQQKTRGSVNGNVLVPMPDERTPLATDPVVRAMISRWLKAYPDELPNRTDVDPRALNTNSPQRIDSNNGTIRLDQALGRRDRLSFSYNYTSQFVKAFQLVAGQNPNTDTRSHAARITWAREWDSRTAMELTAGFDRLGSFLHPEVNAVGPMVSIPGLEGLGPSGIIPVDRSMNTFKEAGTLRHTAGTHQWTAGFQVLRRQLNGLETDVHRGFYGFSSDFGRSGIQNFLLGAPSQYIQSVGDTHRGFRDWEMQFYAGDSWKATPNLTLQYSLRYTPVTTPVEVNNLNQIPYQTQSKNFGPMFGIAYRLPDRWGVIRSAYGLHFGEIYPVTFQQVRLSPPGSTKLVVTAPNMLDPLHTPGATTLGNLYLLDPNLSAPYEHQYNFSWEPTLGKNWHLQLGYVGSRAERLLIMWYLNRAVAMPGIPQTTATINARRPDPNYAEKRWVTNGSRAYFDAMRASLTTPRWRGLTVDAAYWFSKAIDLGSAYSGTAYDVDSRLSRSQSMFESNKDMKGVSTFDQPHAFLLHLGYDAPRKAGRWTLSGVVLLKSGSPFTVYSGSDSPGYGNVDGNGGDRPNLLDPSILGRSIDNPNTSRARLPRSAFSFMSPTDLGGNLGRDTFRRGGYRNVNASLVRRWTLPHETTLALRAESINLFNTPQFAAPGTDVSSANFGQITNTLNDGRTFKFGLTVGW
jgi:hypothetical protein